MQRGVSCRVGRDFQVHVLVEAFVCWFVLPLPTSVQFMGNGHDFDLTYYASRNPRLKIEGRSIVLKDRPTVAGGPLLFLLFAAPLFC